MQAAICGTEKRCQNNNDENVADCWMQSGRVQFLRTREERVQFGNIPEMRKISERERGWRAMLTLPIKKEVVRYDCLRRKERGVQRNQAVLRQPVYECVRFSPGRRTDGIWRGSTGRNPEAVAGTSSIQKWVLEGFAGSCLQMHPAICKKQAGGVRNPANYTMC